MAAKKAANLPIQDNSFFYSDLAFMPPEAKLSPLWFAQAIFYAKMNNVRFLDPKRAKKYRDLDRMKINPQEYIDLIDPPTPMGGGGQAKYFASDWKDMPLSVHLDNIVKAKLDKLFITNNLQVDEIDKFAKSQRQAEKDRIIFQHAFRNLINDLNKEIGLPAISESESPYEYVGRLDAQEEKAANPEAQQGAQPQNPSKKDIAGVDDLSKLIDQIRMKIKDENSLALYERYVYKGGLERAFELAIQHYLMNLNKFRTKCDYFLSDLEKFNLYCGRYYTDQNTGRGTVEYLLPEMLYTSPFYEKNGDDLEYWFYEKDIPFADFVRQFGKTVSDEKLKQIFELNKANNTVHGLDWNTTPINRRNTALIRIGYFSALSQDANKFSEEYVENRTPGWQTQNIDWKPDKDSDKEKNKMYNVWYSCYYIPPPGQFSSNMPTSWQWQADYIFNIKKNTDMYRYGVDQRFARSELVIWKDDRPSFTDIKESFMSKIRTTWHKFQNCLVQDTNAVVIDWDFMTAIFGAADEENKNNPADPDKPTGGNGVDAGLEMFKMIRQGGIGFMKFRDKNGNFPPGFDPSKFFVHVDTKHIEKAEHYLAMILQQYELMKVALAQNDVTEGQSPKPRTPVEGLKASVEAASNAMWFLEKPARELIVMFAEREVQRILYIIKEHKKYGSDRRWKELADVIGMAQVWMLEGIEDLNAEDIGLNVSLEDTSQMQEYVFQLANQMATNKEVNREAVGLVIDANKYNWKYAYCLLMLAEKEKQREMQEQAELEHQRAMELQQMQMQIAMQLEQAKTQGKVSEIQAQGQINSMLQDQINALKFQSQSALKDKTTQNRIAETDAKIQKEADVENQKPMQLYSEGARF